MWKRHYDSNPISGIRSCADHRNRIMKDGRVFETELPLPRIGARQPPRVPRDCVRHVNKIGHVIEPNRMFQSDYGIPFVVGSLSGVRQQSILFVSTRRALLRCGCHAVGISSTSANDLETHMLNCGTSLMVISLQLEFGYHAACSAGGLRRGSAPAHQPHRGLQGPEILLAKAKLRPHCACVFQETISKVTLDSL